MPPSEGTDSVGIAPVKKGIERWTSARAWRGAAVARCPLPTGSPLTDNQNEIREGSGSHAERAGGHAPCHLIGRRALGTASGPVVARHQGQIFSSASPPIVGAQTFVS